MTRPTGRTLALVLGTDPEDGATIAALRLAEEAIDRGHRVAVYAYGDGVRVGADATTTGPVVASLLRRGLHGGLLSWVTDRAAADACTTGRPVAGVVEGDAGDLWRFVREADVALGVTR
ncbi:MAG: DsrE family protein [Actinobacteria bacterium]|nr:DsrE family protein [Actinomycetota bacterium]